MTTSSSWFRLRLCSQYRRVVAGENLERGIGTKNCSLVMFVNRSTCSCELKQHMISNQDKKTLGEICSPSPIEVSWKDNRILQHKSRTETLISWISQSRYFSWESQYLWILRFFSTLTEISFIFIHVSTPKSFNSIALHGNVPHETWKSNIDISRRYFFYGSVYLSYSVRSGIHTYL